MEKTWYNSNIHDASFISFKQDFINSARGINWLRRSFPFVKRGYLSIGNELIIEQVDGLDEFKDKKVLVVGGGPSTRDIGYDESKYDSVVSLNHFFLHDKLSKTPLDLVTVSQEVDVLSKEFNDYIQEFRPIVCFENYLTKHPEKLLKFYNSYDKACMCHTRYMSVIGGCPRLIWLISSLRAAEIDIIGMDGAIKTLKIGDDANHAFQTSKKSRGTYDYDLYINIYRDFWSHLLRVFGESCKFTNLGYGHAWNMSTLVADKNGRLLNE